jgi:hypothetical protein
LDTYRPPVLEEPQIPYWPPLAEPSFPKELPPVGEVPEPAHSKKIILVPEGGDAIPDTGAALRFEDGLPLPDRKVVREPISATAPDFAAVIRSDGPLPTLEPPSSQTAFSSPIRDSERVAPTGLPDFTVVKGFTQVANGRKPTIDG